MKKYNVLRIAEVVMGIVHALFFFVIPFATLSGLAQGIGSFASMLGMGDAYPDKLTGLAAFKMGYIFGDDAIIIQVIFLTVFIAGIVIAIFSLIPKLWTYLIIGLMSVIQLLGYGLGVICLQDFAQIGYVATPVIYIAIVLAIAQIVVSIVAKIKEKKSSDSVVKVGKHDGIITGMTGEYTGVKMPIKAGESIKIGRNSEMVNIVVKGESVSREHCEVSYDGKNSRYIIKDLSKFGTFKTDGSKLDKESILTPGSVIQIGPNGDTFRLG
jgi:hypothetical protein